MSAPFIQGTLVRDTLLYNGNGSSDKEYKVTITATAVGSFNVYTEYGPRGRLSNGQIQVAGVDFSTAKRKSDAIIAAKVKKGYEITHDNVNTKAVQDMTPPLKAKKPAARKVAPKVMQPDALSAESKAVLRGLF